MSQCNDCKATDGLLEIAILNLAEGEDINGVFCRRCLIAKNLYCPDHDEAKTCFFHPSLLDPSGGAIPVLNVCDKCILNETRALSPQRGAGLLALLRQEKGEEYVTNLRKSFYAEALEELRGDDKVLFALLYTACMYGETLEETVSQMIIEDSGQLLQ